MTDYEDGYDAAMEQTNSFNYEPPMFERIYARGKEIYCWRCHRELAPQNFYFCIDCDQECFPTYWGA
jgi:hypothetical protein